jgi:hypothetical protein
MKTASIKRGSIVTNVVPIKECNNLNPVGTLGQVTRVLRKKGQVVVKFRDGYGYIVPLENVALSPVNNQKVPKVGDLFCSSWGYDQTNIDFYQVTAAISANTVEVRRCGSKQTDYQNLSGHVKADKGNLQGEPKKHRVLYDMQGNPSFKVASYARAWPTDENAEHFFSEWH